MPLDVVDRIFTTGLTIMGVTFLVELLKWGRKFRDFWDEQMLSSRDLSRSTRGIAEIAIDWNPDPTGAVPQKYQLIHPPVDT